MFLVEDKQHGVTHLVFTWEDPRKAGYRGTVIEEVSLDYDMEKIHSWPDGEEAPEACVGRERDNPKHYKVFKYCPEVVQAGYEPVAGDAVVFGKWADYVRLRLKPPDPEETNSDQWFDYLDELDRVARDRSLRSGSLAAPASSNRDEIAAWLAKKHFRVDSGVREVWYLPQGAPPDEIRLLELRDRFAGNESKVEPVDFGLEIEGEPFRLLVADVSSEQVQSIKADPSGLPNGWSLDGSKVWTRRGA